MPMSNVAGGLRCVGTSGMDSRLQKALIDVRHMHLNVDGIHAVTFAGVAVDEPSMCAASGPP